MPTLLTDPRSGGVKKTSGVNVLPCVMLTWEEVRDLSNNEVNWLIAGYNGPGKNDVSVLLKGKGGVEECASSLPQNQAVFGGVQLQKNGRFVTFFYSDPGTSIMEKGKASMQKNGMYLRTCFTTFGEKKSFLKLAWFDYIVNTLGVLNVLEGSDFEIDINPTMTEDDITSVNNGEKASKTINKVTIKADKNNSSPIHTEPKNERNYSFNDVSELSLDNKKPEMILENVMDVSKEDKSTENISYSKLKGISDPSLLPKGVDPNNREMSLSDSEFEEVFGMRKQSYMALPAWKRVTLKKAKQLF